MFPEQQLEIEHPPLNDLCTELGCLGSGPATGHYAMCFSKTLNSYCVFLLLCL